MNHLTAFAFKIGWFLMVQKDVAIFMIYRAFETKQYGDSAFLHSLNTDWKIITFYIISLFMPPNFEKVGDILVSACPCVCVCVCVCVFMFEISS